RDDQPQLDLDAVASPLAVRAAIICLSEETRQPLPTLSSSARARLPDSAFAYVDSKGTRRLPLNDASHVRNALARFEQVSFDGDAGLGRDVRRVIRTSVRGAGGKEVDARADEFFAVFKEPRPAVNAALAIQRSLKDHAWPDRAVVCVRIGIHTGRSNLTESGY